MELLQQWAAFVSKLGQKCHPRRRTRQHHHHHHHHLNNNNNNNNPHPTKTKPTPLTHRTPPREGCTRWGSTRRSCRTAWHRTFAENSNASRGSAPPRPKVPTFPGGSPTSSLVPASLASSHPGQCPQRLQSVAPIAADKSVTSFASVSGTPHLHHRPFRKK